MSTIVTFVIGLIVGWNFLKQPEWSKKTVDLVVEKVKSYISK
jgi:hypothetical protein